MVSTNQDQVILRLLSKEFIGEQRFMRNLIAAENYRAAKITTKRTRKIVK